MRLEIKELQSKLGITSLYVTHDQVEAMTMADRMIVMNAGVAEQIGTPLEVYETPRTLFAAQFIGSPAMNIVDAEVKGGKILFQGQAVADTGGADGPVKLGVRPEHLIPDENGPLRVTIKLAEPLGANTLLHGAIEGSDTGFTVSLQGVHQLTPTDDIRSFRIEPGKAHVFEVGSGLRRVAKTD